MGVRGHRSNDCGKHGYEYTQERIPHYRGNRTHPATRRQDTRSISFVAETLAQPPSGDGGEAMHARHVIPGRRNGRKQIVEDTLTAKTSRPTTRRGQPCPPYCPNGSASGGTGASNVKTIIAFRFFHLTCPSYEKKAHATRANKGRQHRNHVSSRFIVVIPRHSSLFCVGEQGMGDI